MPNSLCEEGGVATGLGFSNDTRCGRGHGVTKTHQNIKNKFMDCLNTLSLGHELMQAAGDGAMVKYLVGGS